MRDLISHVEGVAEDAVSGNVAEAGQANWTQTHIEGRKNDSVQDLVERWATVGEMLDPGLDNVHPAMAGLIVSDLVTHEHDLRAAVGKAGARDSEGVALATNSYARRFGRRIKEAGLPALTLETEGASWNLGNGDPLSSVRGDAFEVLRALSGRRTRDQIAAFDWSGDAEAYLPVFSGYGEPAEPLEE